MSAYVEGTRTNSLELSDESASALVRMTEGARATLREQARSIMELADRVDDSFAQAVGLLYATPGHVILCGIGKSGHIGRKIAATLASTGTPAFFVHPAEAFHGDLGMITGRDTVVLISSSGETEEVVRLLPHIVRLGASIIALVGRPGSTIASAADVVLDVSVTREVCPNNLAPTTSTLVTLAMGDALSVALIRLREFGSDDFARLHPGGALGRRLHSRVKDLMHSRDLPVVTPSQTVRDSLFTITRGRLGLALVFDGEALCGIITDGDLRRAMQRYEDVLEVKVAEIMSANPITISERSLLTEAEKLMRRRKVKALVAVDERGKVSGIVEIFQR